MSQSARGFFTRRAFLKMLGSSAVFLAHFPLIAKSQRLFLSDFGTMSLSGTDCDPVAQGIQVLPQQYVTWVLEYTAGTQGIQPGGKIRIKLNRFHESWISDIQCSRPSRPGYVTYSTNGSCLLDCTIDYGYLTVEILEQALLEGEKVAVVLGDTSEGSVGFIAAANAGKYIANPLYPQTSLHPKTFNISVAPTGTSNFIDLDEPELHYETAPAELARIDVVMPSLAAVGEPVGVVLRVTDQYGNLIKDFDGDVSLSSNDPGATFPPQVSFTPADEGHKSVGNTMFDTPGINSLYASIAGNPAECYGNPLECSPGSVQRRLLWGDIHIHTQLSDGRETPDYAFGYGRNISNLDFMACSEHTYHPTKAQWIEERAKPKVEEFYQEGAFTTLLAFEWSEYKDCYPMIYGHRNVYYRGMDGIFMASWGGDYNDPDLIFAALKGQKALVIPHHPAWGWFAMAWDYHHPKFQRLIEIYSIHGMSEYYGNARDVPYPAEGHYVQDGLALGQKLGIICSSDSHLTRPGLKTPYDIKKYRAGLIAVYAEQNTREVIWDAMYNRHCYGTTGERIILDFRINGEVMGSELPLRPGSYPEIYVKAIGTDILHRVEIVKAHIGAALPFPTVYEVNPGICVTEFTWTDTSEPSDCFYYVRVTQADTEMAWAGPIWVSPSMNIQNIRRDKVIGDITIRWGSLPHRLYSVYYKDLLDGDWQLAQTDIPSHPSGTIEWTDDGTYTGFHPSNVQQRYYAVRADG